MRKNDKTESGLIIPDTARPLESFCRGIVISVGQDVQSDITPGVMLAFAEFGGQDMMYKSKIYKVLKYGEVYCVLGDDD